MIKSFKTIIMLFTALWLCHSACYAATVSGASLAQDEQFVHNICSNKIKDKNNAIKLLQTNSQDNTKLIEDIVNNKAYCITTIAQLAFKHNDIYYGYDGQSLSEDLSSKLKAITISSLKKSNLKKIIEQSYLFSDNEQKRLQAVTSILEGDNTLPKLDTINQLMQLENNQAIYQALKVMRANALALTDNVGSQELLEAIEILKEHGQHIDIITLQQLLHHSNDNVVTAAQDALNHIDNLKSIAHFVQNLFFGLSLGSVLVLSAIGLSITFGVMGVINMAHGEFMMIGAYCVYVLQSLMPNSPGSALLLAIPTAFIVCGLLGIVVERSIIRFLYKRPLETLLATFGLSLFLQQLIRSIFSPLNKPITTPELLQGSIMFGNYFEFTVSRVMIIGYCILCFFAILLIVKQSRLGLEVRAVSQNRAIARSLGVQASRVDAMTFGLGSAIAGLAGVALSLISNVGPNLGQNYIIDSFMVVVFGGVGSLWGTLTGGLILGIANKFLEPVSGAMLSKIIILVVIIIFIQKKPSGLFPQKGRAIED